MPELKKGDIVTFSYDHFSSKGIPVKPKLVKIRNDITWKELVANINQPPPDNVPSKGANGMFFNIIYFVSIVL